MRYATCHPESKHYAKGLCSACYQVGHRKVWKPVAPATCHPERAHKCRGLCSACYQRAKLQPGFLARGRAAQVNTCGHPDKPHAGGGKCGACLTKARRARDPEADKLQRKDYQLRATYGMTLTEFHAMYQAQGSACALCRKAVPSERDRHVDHCHDTGAIRGILCFSCNKGLGLLGDDAAGLLRALAYVSGDTVERIAAKAGVFIPLERAA